MARACQLCGRRKLSSINRSHSNIATKRYQRPNLQTVNINGKSVLSCTQCIKSHTKELSQTT